MIIVLRGPQGCGKSRFCSLVRPDIVISSDAFRRMLCGNSQYQRISRDAFTMLHQVVESRAASGVPTVVDATNSSSRSIKPFRDIAAKYGADFHIIDFQIYDIHSLMRNIRHRAENGGLYVPRAVVVETVNRLMSNTEQVKAMVPPENYHVITESMTAAEVETLAESILTKNHFFVSIPVTKNFWAIGDIHGCIKSYEALIKTLEEKGATDIVLLGDYVDRGPDSVRVVQKIGRQQKKEDGNAFNLYAIRGNHDTALYRELKFNEFCRSVPRKVTHQHVKDAGAADDMIRIIEGMRHIMSFMGPDEKMVLATHAGINHVNAELPNRGLAASEASWKTLDDEEKKYLRSLSEDFVQVHGHRHWEFKDEIDPVMANLDGGVVYNGALVAYNPFTREVVKQPLIDEVQHITEESGEVYE